MELGHSAILFCAVHVAPCYVAPFGASFYATPVNPTVCEATR
jgi:hypothetical protein